MTCAQTTLSTSQHSDLAACGVVGGGIPPAGSPPQPQVRDLFAPLKFPISTLNSRLPSTFIPNIILATPFIKAQLSVEEAIWNLHGCLAPIIPLIAYCFRYKSQTNRLLFSEDFIRLRNFFKFCYISCKYLLVNLIGLFINHVICYTSNVTTHL